MTDQTPKSGSGGRMPWKSILSVLAVTRFSDWLASQAAPSEQPDGTVSRPSLTARALQVAVRAGGATAVTAILAQAKNRNRRNAAIRTALGVPGHSAASVRPLDAKTAGSKSMSGQAVTPVQRRPIAGAKAATQPSAAMQAAAGAVDGLLSTLGGGASPEQIPAIRDQIEGVIDTLETAQLQATPSDASLPASLQAMSDAADALVPNNPTPNRQQVVGTTPPAQLQATPSTKTSKAVNMAPVATSAIKTQAATRSIGRVRSFAAQAMAKLQRRPLVDSQTAAGLLRLTPDEFAQLHEQRRIAGHVADTSSGPLFERGHMRPGETWRAMSPLPELIGPASEYDTARALGVEPQKLQALRESGQIVPSMDETSGIRRYQYSGADRQQAQSLLAAQSESSDESRIRTQAATTPAKTVVSPSVSASSQKVDTPKAESGIRRSPDALVPANPTTRQTRQTARQEVVGSIPAKQMPSLWQRMRQFGRPSTSPLHHDGTGPTPAMASRIGTVNSANVVADQVQARNQPVPVRPLAKLAKRTAARWLGPAGAAALGIQTQEVSAQPNGAGTASVPPAASAGSRSSSSAAMNQQGGVSGSGGGSGNKPPTGPPIDSGDDSEDEPQRRKHNRRRKHTASSGRRGHARPWLSENAIRLIPKRFHHLARQINAIPRPSRAVQVMSRRRARQAVGAMGKTRIGGAAMKMAGRVLPMAGRVLASPVGGAAAAGAGAMGMVTGGVALALGFTVIATLLTGLVASALRSFVNHINEGNRGLAQYNGHIAVAFARLDYNRIRREIERGRHTSASSTFLTRQVDQLEESLEPLSTIFANVTNYAAGAAAWVGSAILSPVNGVIEGGGAVASGAVDGWLATQRSIAESLMSLLGMSEEQIAEERKHQEELRKIEENTRKADSAGLGIQVLQRLENPNYQNMGPALPQGPMPQLWQHNP